MEENLRLHPLLVLALRWERKEQPMTESRLCAFCENKPATEGKYCAACAKLADDALDEIAGGPGKFEEMLAKHLAKGTRQ